VTGATSYAVYRRTATSGWVYSGAVASTTFVDSGLASATTYWYAIAAVDAAGPSAWSPEAQGTTP
jgi:chitodextrinase